MLKNTVHPSIHTCLSSKAPLAWERQLREHDAANQHREAEQIIMQGMARAFANMMRGMPETKLPKVQYTTMIHLRYARKLL